MFLVWPGLILILVSAITGACAMRPTSARTSVISAAALGGSLLWGAVEFVALQWTRLAEKWQATRASVVS